MEDLRARRIVRVDSFYERSLAMTFSVCTTRWHFTAETRVECTKIGVGQ